MSRPSCQNQSAFITRKELAAAAEISEDTLKRKPELDLVRRAMEDARDKLSDKPIRYNSAVLRTRLSLYGHQDLAQKIKG